MAATNFIKIKSYVFAIFFVSEENLFFAKHMIDRNILYTE